MNAPHHPTHWILLSLVLISLFFSAFIFYQGQQLNKQLNEFSASLNNPISNIAPQPTSAPTTTNTSSTKKIIITDTDQKPISDPYEIIDLNLENLLLSIEVSYSGGCKQHVFNLYWDRFMAKSIPPLVTLYLVHNSNEDRCEALIKEKLTFDISPLITEIGTTTKIWLYNYATNSQYPKGVTAFAEKICGWVCGVCTYLPPGTEILCKSNTPTIPPGATCVKNTSESCVVNYPKD